jgi:hypothetical protein
MGADRGRDCEALSSNRAGFHEFSGARRNIVGGPAYRADRHAGTDFPDGWQHGDGTNLLK